MEGAAGEGAIVFLHDALADPEAEAGALGGFGGEEGLEETPDIVGMNADAGVDDGDGGAAALPVSRSASRTMDAQSAAVGHGLDGVADEVEKDLAQLDREAAEPRA